MLQRIYVYMMRILVSQACHAGRNSPLTDNIPCPIGQSPRETGEKEARIMICSLTPLIYTPLWFPRISVILSL